MRLRLASGEVEEVLITGEMDDRLRHCLESSIEGLDMPRFDDVILVTYPMVTRGQVRPPTVELAPDLAHEVDAIGADG